MAKKKGFGLSRKQLQRLGRLTKIKRSKDGLIVLPKLHTTYEATGVIKVADLIKHSEPGTIVVRIEGEGRPALIGKASLKYRIKTAAKPERKIASLAVEASTQRVIDSLGIKILDVPHKPETVHTLGTMIAAEAITMARTMAPTGRIGGGSVLASIGRSSIDFSVGPTGVVVASSRSSKSSGIPTVGKTGKVIFPASPDSGSSGGSGVTPVEVPSTKKKTKKGNGLDVGETVIIKDEHGVTHFHIQTLNVYITADLVQQLNVNPQTVQNILASKLKGLSETVENGKQSQLEDKEKKAEKETDEEEDDDKKKTKKKKKKGEDEE